ncbi:NuoI/complex I 23 kDa subunit family protein [Clostridium beijerinckii]|uniref:NADH-quinone oxidoreductase subunit I n=1 Tax=Clostridium beijerinckii TaxID=1520 RepID=A0A9Q5GJ16_CLOBE|nr:NADH-quinone oxidoreductase subunit I [Clostridium beijerinckii]AQS05734.1 NADH-quinone oxidoreductase subunit I [Clostridium beijerinckii]MBA2885363.1 NADH-quinone oxidoreductase subunit I [Clostridium beijerinckii]MBA2900136.1 NADH-quinone oxidoreductase subunit I [Clostridium beijerinckii]MBA2909765.1 NADH-quinone oxidoreductase subunit I [Clostridium beijerinckii]MBA9014670.1 NADH-quinone oxidoreductase subunit I [Clostridium beijerinckii]
MFGKGLLNGLRVTLGHLFEKNITQQYPEEHPKLPLRSRCSFRLDSEKCISCSICALSCPNRVINVESYKDENNKKRLTKYEMQLEYCLFCGLCVESCPAKALQVTSDFELSAYSRAETKLTLFDEYSKK